MQSSSIRFNIDGRILSGSGGVQFNRTGLNETIKVLENKYGIKIVVSTAEIQKCRFTATFYNVDDEPRTLQAIEHSLNVEFIKLSESKYSLTGSPCADF